MIMACSQLNAFGFEGSIGVHDMVVPNIVNDTPNDGIEGGTSHTLGIDGGIWVKHQAPWANLSAKLEVFVDHDKDKLDPDHIPVWFDAFIDIDAEAWSIDEHNRFQWFVLLDNKQNTVSGIERQVRQHVGAGYNYHNDRFSLEANGYVGFYFIEFDDDTPVNRGYTRGVGLDIGEASHVLELQAHYDFTSDVHLFAGAKRYAANTGAELLQNEMQMRISFASKHLFTQGGSWNLQVKYAHYNLDHFYNPIVGRPILPFDEDILMQAYVKFPLFQD